MRVLGGISEADRRERAIRINVERRHLTRRQRQELLADLIKSSPSTSNRDLADIFKVDQSTVGRAKKKLMAGGAFAPPDRINGLDGKLYPYRHPAVAVETPRQAQEACDLLNTLGDDAPEGAITLRKLHTLAAQQRREDREADPVVRLPARVKLRHCSYEELKLKPESVSLILTDPPWSQDRNTLSLWEGLGAMAGRVLQPEGMLLTYVGQAGLPRWLEILGRHLTYRWQIVCVNKTGHSIAATRGSFGILNAHRSLLLFSKGAFRPFQTIKDTLVTDGTEKEFHEFQQPLSESLYFVERLCPPGGLVCDPLCGSGTVAHAVLLAGAGRRFVGCDVDPIAIKKARRRIAQALEQKSSEVSTASGVAG
jgi:site-specific DNA-methyltransferase (adenine-specific)